MEPKIRRKCGSSPKKSVEQAEQAFDTFVAAAQHAVKTAKTQTASTRSGIKEVGALAMGYAERNINSCFELAQKLMRAKDAKEVMALHSEYVSGRVRADRTGQERIEQASGQDDRALRPPFQVRSC